MIYIKKIIFNSLIILIFIIIIISLNCTRFSYDDWNKDSSKKNSEENFITGWKFVDGNDMYGISYNQDETAKTPQLFELNDKLHIIWLEQNDITYQVRMAVWDNSSDWQIIDGNQNTGLNWDTSISASNLQIITHNSKLYAKWQEEGRIRVAEWDGSDIANWEFIDGNTSSGMYITDSNHYINSYLLIYNSKPLLVWFEEMFDLKIFRMALYDDITQKWSYIEGDPDNDPYTAEFIPSASCNFVEYNNNLYCAFTKSNISGGTKYLRISRWDETNGWVSVDGDNEYGLNKSNEQGAGNPNFFKYKNKLYISWQEIMPQIQIRIAVWDGVNIWNHIDGNGDYGINYYYDSEAKDITYSVFSSKLVVSWSERDRVSPFYPQIRSAYYNENNNNPEWIFLDGALDYGMNYDRFYNVYTPYLYEFNSELFITWSEAFDKGDQVRVIQFTDD